MVQVEMNNMYINVGANNGGEKLWTKKKHTATSGKLIKQVYVSCVYVYRFYYFIIRRSESCVITASRGCTCFRTFRERRSATASP